MQLLTKPSMARTPLERRRKPTAALHKLYKHPGSPFYTSFRDLLQVDSTIETRRDEQLLAARRGTPSCVRSGCGGHGASKPGCKVGELVLGKRGGCSRFCYVDNTCRIKTKARVQLRNRSSPKSHTRREISRLRPPRLAFLAGPTRSPPWTAGVVSSLSASWPQPRPTAG